MRVAKISDAELRDLIKGLDNILGGPEVFMDIQELDALLLSYGIEPGAADEVVTKAVESALYAWQAKNAAANMINVGKEQ